MRRHWPLVLGVLLALAALLGYWLRGSVGSSSTTAPQSKAPGTGTGSEPGVSVQDPSSPTPSGDPDPKPAAKIATGSLRILLEGAAAPLNGQVVVLTPEDVPDTSLEVAGTGRVEVRADKLKPGPKRVVYVSQSTYLPAVGEATVEPEKEAELTLTLRSAGGLKGTVVDSLLRPFPGVTVEVSVPAVFAPRSAHPQAFSVWFHGGGRSGGRAGGTPRTPVHSSRSLWSDGHLEASVSTDDEGEFELDGIAGPVTVTVRYKDVSFTQACLPDADNMFIVPALPQAPPVDLKAEALQKSIQAMLRQMAIHHDNPEPYAAQLREILYRNLEGMSIPEKEREEIRKRIESIGRVEPKR
jgi:hypothetical protein